MGHALSEETSAPGLQRGRAAHVGAPPQVAHRTEEAYGARGDLVGLGRLSDQAIARAQGVNRNTVILCIQKCLRFGVQAALGELPRSGKPRRVSDAAMAWVQNCACQKPKELGYAQELWTYGLLTAHLRQQARAAGYPELERVSRSKLHKILRQGELRPHKVRYYVERRDPEFESKMAAVLHVYKEVEILNQGLLRGEIREPGTVTVSYDEKPGIQALAQKTPDLPPIPGQHASPTRDYEYKRLGTVSLLAGLDLHRGTVTEIVSETHKSKDFIELLKKLDEAYPPATTLRLILDNHSAHVSRETLPGEPAATLSVRLRSQARFVAQSGGEYVQQDGAQHAPGDPGAEQTGTHRANPPVLPRSECRSGGIPMEVQDG